MPSGKIRRALGAVKDQTSIGLAKVGSSASLADLDVAIVKATRHEEQPAEEKHIREILSLTCYSRVFISACVNTLARRLNKTKNWTVALKTLILVQRLLNDGDPAYEQEIFFSTRQGTRFLNMSDFRDSSSSSSWDYSAFVRTFALYLDERLEYRMQSRRGRRSVFGFDEDDDDVAMAAGALTLPAHQPPMTVAKATPVREMKNDQVFSRAQHLQQLLQRILACRPTGAARANRVVIVAMYPTVRESFQTYFELTETMGILVDRFMEMEVPDCVKVFDIFSRLAKQFDDLDLFYNWCKSDGISRTSDYPDVDKITPKKLQAMDDFIRDKTQTLSSQNTLMIEHQQHQDQQEEEVKEEEEQEQEQDLNAIKALPAPEQDHAEDGGVEEDKKLGQREGDLLNLGEGGLSSAEAEGDRLALALFDGAPAAESAAPVAPGWEAFPEGAADWETALVETASGLRGGQIRAGTLAGGFDMPMLDGMYRRAEETAAMSAPAFGGGGSASSVALGSAGRPAMLALPAPAPAAGGGAAAAEADPFAASLAVAAPAYVQMSEMEKKQRLLVEEQMMWQQYARDGMQGKLNMQGGPTYTRTY